MRRDLLLGVDAGHSVTKAVLFDSTGKQLGMGSTKVPLNTAHPYWVERGLDDVWHAAQRAISACLTEAGEGAGAAVAAVGVTGHGDGLYAVDERGRPVRSAIMAMDARAEPVLAGWRARPTWERVLTRSGSVPFAGSPAALLTWLGSHEPDVLERARWLLFCKDWLRLKLTGAVSTDPTDASASFTDVHRGGFSYSSELLDLYGLRHLEWKLPPVVASTAVAGYVTSEAAKATGLTAGTPVAAGAHDADAAALGVGSTVPGMLCLVAGTFSINQVIGDRPLLDPRWQARHFVRPEQWMLMSTSPTSVTNLEWFLRVARPSITSGSGGYNVINREVEACLEGRSDVLFLPFVYGSPRGRRASGAFLGVRGWHSRGHLARGLLEGVVLNHRWHVEALDSRLHVAGPARLTGGAARSKVWSQMFADALHRSIEVTNTDESAARGAALLAASAVGLLDGIDDNRARVTVVRLHEPNETRGAVLDEAYQAYLEALETLGPLWNRLAQE